MVDVLPDDVFEHHICSYFTLSHLRKMHFEEIYKRKISSLVNFYLSNGEIPEEIRQVIQEDDIHVFGDFIGLGWDPRYTTMADIISLAIECKSWNIFLSIDRIYLFEYFTNNRNISPIDIALEAKPKDLPQFLSRCEAPSPSLHVRTPTFIPVSKSDRLLEIYTDEYNVKYIMDNYTNEDIGLMKLLELFTYGPLMEDGIHYLESQQ